nr:putative ribonuclease H-like domain-containing protein [Tanacetum cinerariifolium]
MCDKKNSVLFTDTECVVLSSNYKLPDENHVLLRVPRENNMYNVDLKNVVPSGGLTCLFTKAILDESNIWHRRLGHINFKTVNKVVKRNLVRGLPSKIFGNKHTCVACQKRKQHKPLADEGFLVGYSVNCKAFRVFNSRTRIVQETLHINFLKNKPNVVGIGPKWLFDIDTLTMSIYYQPVVAGNQANDNADLKNTDDDVADDAFEVKKNENDVHVSANESDKTDKKKHDEKAKRDDKGKSSVDLIKGVRDLRAEFEEFSFNNTNKYTVFGMEFACKQMFQVLGKHHTSNGHQFTMSNRHQELTSPEQTTSGVSTPRCDEDSIELKELMVFIVPIYVLRKIELELLLVIYS